MKRIAFLKNKNRNDSISIGASVLIQELVANGMEVDICNYETAFDYDLVLVSMTATEDLFDLFGNMDKYHWGMRTFKVLIGGFGCQNPWSLWPYADFAFFGRADGVICDVVGRIFKGEIISILTDYPCISLLNAPREVILRQTDHLYEGSVRYGKNNSRWIEKFIGCPYRCKFCHYSWNRNRIGGKQYINDGLSAGSPEIMMNDICNEDLKRGRFTTALDGYSERLRFLFGKRITWENVEAALDHTASFKGNSYIKLYNIHNFPTETEEDREEFFRFFENYAENSMKPDGVVTVEVLNTAFRPSINTPMQRLEARLYPPARYEDNRVAHGEGFSFKMSVNNRDAYSHLEDLISIRNTEKDFGLIHFIATDKEFKKKNNKEKITYLANHYSLEDFTRRYALEEPLEFNKIDNGLHMKKQEEILFKKLGI